MDEISQGLTMCSPEVKFEKSSSHVTKVALWTIAVAAIIASGSLRFDLRRNFFIA